MAEVIDADLNGDAPYIVTRFVPGRTLDDVVTQDGPLCGRRCPRLACGLADALVAVPMPPVWCTATSSRAT